MRQNKVPEVCGEGLQSVFAETFILFIPLSELPSS